MKHSKENKMGLLALAVFFIAMNVSGCASHSKTVHTETVGNPPAQGVVVQQETTTSTTDHREYGILGGAFHVVGEILAFPFEVIASAFRFIF